MFGFQLLGRYPIRGARSPSGALLATPVVVAPDWDSARRGILQRPDPHPEGSKQGDDLRDVRLNSRTDDLPSELQHLREAIERVDRDLLELFKRRMTLVEAVATAKIRAAYPFRDRLRAEQVLQRVRQMATEMGLDAHQMEQIFRLIMEMAISHQQAYLKTLPEAPLRVAYQGVEGSFSHLTAQRHYRNVEGGVLLTGYESFREAADSVRTGANDVALLPIENSTAGSINETYDLLTEEGLVINAEAISRVSHCLLALPGARKQDIRVILSHPQALLQCGEFLRSTPFMRPQAVFDTAGAARQVKEGNDPTFAAIASESAARVFGLEVLERNIQNQMGNYTRFVEVAREAGTCPPDRPCKTSVLLATGHQPGDLGEVLREFSKRSINLTKLESRPVPDRPFQYRFYLDFEGHASSEPVSEALAAILPRARELRILGTYPRASDELPSAPEPPPGSEPSERGR